MILLVEEIQTNCQKIRFLERKNKINGAVNVFTLQKVRGKKNFNYERELKQCVHTWAKSYTRITGLITQRGFGAKSDTRPT
jgi:hypothetical protein